MLFRINLQGTQIYNEKIGHQAPGYWYQCIISMSHMIIQLSQIPCPHHILYRSPIPHAV